MEEIIMVLIWFYLESLLETEGEMNKMCFSGVHDEKCMSYS